MSVVHVLPLDDLIAHDDEGDECVCGVDLVPVKDNETGTLGWVVVHHALDGRERFE